MSTYKIGFSYTDDGFCIIPEADDEDIARLMATDLLKELKGAVITSIEAFDDPQDAVDSINEAPEGNKYVN